MDTDILILRALLGFFLITGLFAAFNAWLGKWGAAIAMLGMSWASFGAGLLFGCSLLWIIPTGIFACIVGSLRLAQSKITDEPLEPDYKGISDRMLADMDRRIAERKRAK